MCILFYGDSLQKDCSGGVQRGFGHRDTGLGLPVSIIPNFIKKSRGEILKFFAKIREDFIYFFQNFKKKKSTKLFCFSGVAKDKKMRYNPTIKDYTLIRILHLIQLADIAAGLTWGGDRPPIG